MFKILFLLFLVSYSPLEARKSMGGGAGRGAGAARGGSPGGGFQPNSGFGGGGGFGGQPGGFGRPQPGGFAHPQPGGGFQGGHAQPGGFGRPQPGGSFGNQAPHFNAGSGPGSMQSKNTFRNALIGGALGAGGALLAFEAGKAIIHSADKPFHHENRDYYWDQQHYKGDPNSIMCKAPFEQIAGTTTTTTSPATPPADPSAVTTTTPSPEQKLAMAQFPDGSRPKEIVWSCKRNTEVCCGTDCCPAPAANTQLHGGASAAPKSSGPGLGAIIFGILFVLLLLGCCCCLIAYKCCRSAFDFIMPSTSNNPNNTYYDDSNKYGEYQQQYPQGAYGQQAQHYPMQPYPQQQQYPAYPQQSQQYSAYPPQPKY